MTGLFAAAAFLLVSHFGISSTALRGWLVARLGERLYLGLYSLIALGAIVWLIVAYAQAPYVGLWPVPGWLAWLPLVVMPFALVLVVSGLTMPNPTAVGAPASGGETPTVHGIFRVTRHPLLWGIGLWALAHVPVSGDLAALVLFATFGLLALLGTRLIDGKLAARRGADWQRLAAGTSNLPFAAIRAGRQRFVAAEIGWWRVALALVLYVALLAAHPWLFGVAPIGA